MAFEVVYRIPKEAFKRSKIGAVFFKQGDFEEHSLLYFLRKSNSMVLHDTPVCGAYLERLLNSDVTGPREFGVHLAKEEGDIDHKYREDVLELFVPQRLMPVTFEPVSLIKYGTGNYETNCELLEDRLRREKINTDDIMNLGKTAIAELSRDYGLCEVSPHFYKTYLKDCLVEFKLQPPPTSGNAHGFDLDIDIFGRSSLAEAIDGCFYDLKRFFMDHSLGIGVESYRQNGLAYNLVLDGTKSIAKNIHSDNIVL